MKKSDPLPSKLIEIIGSEERELKLGTSFTNPRESAFHTLRYDFKPASVDANKMATIDVQSNSQVTVNLPPNFLFKGNAKPYHRQCIAIVNPVTGDVTLEKLTFNIQVKNIRSENQKMSAKKMSMIDQYISGQKPTKPTSIKGSKTHTLTNNNSSNNGNSNSSNNSNKKNSGLKLGKKSKAKPSHPTTSTNSSLPTHSNSTKNSPNFLTSIPPGLSPTNASPSKTVTDDQAALEDWFYSLDSGRSNAVKQDTKKIPPKDEVKPPVRHNDDVGELSDSSSSCGSSGSGDSSDSSSDSEPQQTKKVSVPPSGRSNNPSADPEVLLKQDLQLSESGSESD